MAYKQKHQKIKEEEENESSQLFKLAFISKKQKLRVKKRNDKVQDQLKPKRKQLIQEKPSPPSSNINFEDMFKGNEVYMFEEKKDKLDNQNQIDVDGDDDDYGFKDEPTAVDEIISSNEFNKLEEEKDFLAVLRKLLKIKELYFNSI